MSDIAHNLTGAELVTSKQYHLRDRSELHALAFLSGYRVEHTRAGYETALRQWFGFCKEHGVEPLEAKRWHIEIFARELEATGRKISTVGGKLNVLAGYYRIAVVDGLIDEDPMAHVKRPAIQRVSSTHGLTRTEFADFLAIAEGRPARDHAIVCLLGLNGMRVSEVCGIDIDDLGRYKGQRTVWILRKGGKRQQVPMAPRTTWQVELAQGDRISGPLFLSVGGGRIDRRAVGRIVARVALEAGIRKRITPHSLRHTFVTLALDANVPERDIALSTGHADTRMVSYYDRGREAIGRNATHAVAAWVEGAS